MAPGNNERHSGHTGTIPKTKVRNNCNVPQEAVTPTRRDMTSNLVTTSLDWVPVSEYNTRTNYSQSRKPTNNTSDHELTDLDNSVSFESGFGRFVPVRPQPRALPLHVQNRENITEQQDDGVASSISGHTLHPYVHQMQNGLIPHSNHASAAVMIVNPTTPNAVTGNVSQPFNASNQNRNNLARNLNPSRNNFEGGHSSHNNTPPIPNQSRGGTKTVNLINNMYEQGQGSFNNINESHSARALGEAMAACGDAGAVERRLGQIREYIRVTSSLVDTMRNSEEEAFVEHTKEEYDELVEMVMKLKESESKLEKILTEKPENVEVPDEEEGDQITIVEIPISDVSTENVNETPTEDKVVTEKPCNVTPENVINNNLKKVTNIENEQLNKSLHNLRVDEEIQPQDDVKTSDLVTIETTTQPIVIQENKDNNVTEKDKDKEGSKEDNQSDIKKDDQELNDILRKNILSCVEKITRIEEMKKEKKDKKKLSEQQEVVTRPVSAQSNGSTYSDNELWQNEIKSKMELSQVRLAALKQQQKRLLKYHEEAKQQLDEMNRERERERQAEERQEIQPSTSHDNYIITVQNQPQAYHHPNRMYAANQIGVATTLPHSDTLSGQQNIVSMDSERGHSGQSSHSQDTRFCRDANVIVNEEVVGRDSELEEDEVLLNERSRMLQIKLRELQMKKQHMENLVQEFQKLQMATGLGTQLNTYSSSGEDSGDEDNIPRNKPASNNKNEDPFKLMEIKAIKTALQKTKDLMRSVENYETEQIPTTHEDAYRELSNHSNIHDNKSEGGWSESSRKLTNARAHHAHAHSAHNAHNARAQHGHEANIASLQELAQELRMETEKIMGERARIKDMISNKEVTRKQKKVNSEVVASTSGVPGPAERRQMQLRALLADKQRELEALLNKEKVLCSSGSDSQKMKPASRTASVVNQSYNSEQEHNISEAESRSEQILLDSQDSRETDNFRGGDGSTLGSRAAASLPTHIASAYGSDTDSASRSKSNQRNRMRRKPPQERQLDDNSVSLSNNTSHQNIRHEARPDSSNVNMVPPISQNMNDSPGNMPYPHPPPPCWNSNKSNQDMRNQFTQNSHSQTMDRLLGTPQMSYPPSMPFNMMMPYGMVGGVACACGCAAWGAWCAQQLATQQRDLHTLRDQLAHLEERWRAETASHTLNNQVPPGNRANNYWDNFRSYSRQNLLSANNKANADGHLGVGHAHNPHPLVERSHNTLHRAPSATPPAIPPKRNTNSTTSQNIPSTSMTTGDDTPNRHPRRNIAYERSLSFSSAPDVLNVNQNNEESSTASLSRNVDETVANVSNVNINRQDPPTNSFRNLNITNPIPEIIQSHSNNLNTTNSKRKSSSKLPAKNSTNRRNCALDYSQMSNINIASTSETPNPNLASTSQENEDKATSKLFDLLRENVYSEVTALIDVNESHPDFLIQLFRELQLISSDTLRQRVLQSIRNVLSQYATIMEQQNSENIHEDVRQVAQEPSTSTPVETSYNEAVSLQNVCGNTMQVDGKIVRFLLLKGEEICTTDFLETLATLILSSTDGRHTQQMKRRLIETLSKYEGLRVGDISGDIIENIPLLTSNESDPNIPNETESAIMQDVAGSLNLFSSSDSQLHQINCPYDLWPGHVHMDIGPSDINDNDRSSQEGKVDLINCSEMHNGDLAEADQSHNPEETVMVNGHDATETLPDVVDTEEVTPTEAEAEWLGLDRVPTRLHMEETSEKQKDLN